MNNYKRIAEFKGVKPPLVCPRFVELRWARGCRFNPLCSWCYLQGTFGKHRGYGTPKLPFTKVYDKKEVENDLRAFLRDVKEPTLLNSGELSDSLMSETAAVSFVDWVVPMFEHPEINPHGHNLLLLTKDTEIKHLLRFEAPKNVIVAYSLNSYTAAATWEQGAPNPAERIKAIRQLVKHDYRIRLRIDPMVPHDNWRTEYFSLAETICDLPKLPERITLGTLRGLQSTINNAWDTSWLKFFEGGESTTWGMKMAEDIREELYRNVIQGLRMNGYIGPVAFCKETRDMWYRFRQGDWRNIKCNCLM